MASRRTAPSRTRANNPVAHPSQSSTRPHSVMSKFGSSARVDQPEQIQQPLARHAQDDAETNIQVVIRCRRRSEREIQDNSPIIVSCGGPKSRDITIETSNPVSSLGVVTLPPTRTYPFDLVFGPEADQATIYHEVVGPMLEQVLSGYNCTLFAYGQTGTGKTYTMQGDLTPTPMGNPSAQAGMIPRVLFRLFHYLETTVTDYSVKISFVELYNEELRDLLSNDLSAPIGSTQPMGMGAGQTSKDSNSNNGLKIFDDAGKRGVLIQGLEEISVKDASDALTLLTKGSQRRQIAATKFNDHSSRSHSVFSITVHTKESSNLGDDLLKIGKLNLVDLAGSENIGRSGAENKRAREAGMINQSLLTLGRVINALVDKSSHVPYRESKLTRLLQDSLGGRTKTCIIATISPARCNMEETLSTLEYARCAKNIRNRPELNQRMTRNSLLKEYVAEIERLKADLLAAREKNGIFFSEDTWNQLNAEQELRQTEIEEARKQIEIMESQMRSVREEFEQSLALLMKRDGELKETKEKLRVTAGELDTKMDELNVVRQALEEEVAVRQAYQANEAVLNEVASGLKNVAKENGRDVNGLFEKLHRKTSVFSSNAKAVVTHSHAILSETTTLSAKFDEFVKTISQSAQTLRVEAMQYQAKELKALSVQSGRIEEQLQRLHKALAGIHEKEEASSEAIQIIESTLKETHECFKNGFEAWGQDMQKRCESICKEAESCSLSGFTSMEKSVKVMNSLMETIVREAQEYIRAEQESISQANLLTVNAVNAEMTRLRQQNETLVRLLESEKEQSELARDQMIKRISVLLSEFTKEREKRLMDTVVVLQASNSKAEDVSKQLSTGHTEITATMTKRGESAERSLNQRSGEGKRTRDGALKTLNTTSANSTDRLSTIHSTITGSVQNHSSQIQKQLQGMNTTYTSALDQYRRNKKARLDATSTTTTEVQSEFRYLQRSVTSTSRNIEAIAGRMTSESNALASATEIYHNITTASLSGLQQATRSLSEQGTQEDTRTGTTPRKRVIEYVDQWPLTKSRDAILREWRRGVRPRAGSDAISEENVALTESMGDRKPNNMNMGTKSDTEKSGEVEAPSPTSPPALSFGSSHSSTATQPPPLPDLIVQVASRKGAIPSYQSTGTLVDRPMNIPETRRSRRAR